MFALLPVLLLVSALLHAENPERAGWIGLGIGMVPPSISEAESPDIPGGAFVYYVVLGSPAESAGVLPGDVIFRVDSTPVEGPDQVTGIFSELAPRDSVRLEVMRFGTVESFGVSLEPLPEPAEADKLRSRVWPGFSVAKLTGEIMSRLKMAHIPGSFVIGRVEMGSPAYHGGLRTGDIISSVEGAEVEDFEEFYHSLNTGGTGISIRIYRRGETGTVMITRTAVGRGD